MQNKIKRLSYRERRAEENRIRSCFKEDGDITVDEERKAAAIQQLSAAAGRIPCHLEASTAEVVRMQLGFLDWRVIVGQFILFLLLAGILGVTGSSLAQSNLYLLGTAAAAAFGIIVVGTCITEEQYHLTELVSSCYLRRSQLCVLRLLLYGGENLIFLSILTAYMGKITGSSLIWVGIYILVPYLCSGSVLLLILLLERRGGIMTFAVAGLVIAVILGAAIVRFPRLYEEAARGLWLAGLLIFGGIYGAELTCMLRQMDRGERLCMN